MRWSFISHADREAVRWQITLIQRNQICFWHTVPKNVFKTFCGCKLKVIRWGELPRISCLRAYTRYHVTAFFSIASFPVVPTGWIPHPLQPCLLSHISYHVTAFPSIASFPVVLAGWIPTHYRVFVRNHLNAKFGHRWIGRGDLMNWSTLSPDLSSMDYVFCEHVKSLVDENPIDSAEDLTTRIVAAVGEIQAIPGMFCECSNFHATKTGGRHGSYAGGRQFEHLLWYELYFPFVSLVFKIMSSE